MLRAIATAAVITALLPGVARGVTWRWPVRGRIVGSFLLSPRDPYAAGQRRGIRIAAGSGAPVRAACGGPVAFAGSVGRGGRTLSVRCGRLRATYQGLGRILVRRGELVLPGQAVAVVGASGVLRLGARVEVRRRASGVQRYVDPSLLLHRLPPVLGPLGRAPRDARGPRPRGGPSLPAPVAMPRSFPSARRVPAPAPAPAPPRGAPVAAWLGLALLGAGLPIGSLWHWRAVRDRVRARRPRNAAAVRR